MNPEAIQAMLANHWPDARIQCTQVGATHAVAALACNERDLRPGGFISGPTQFAVADAALWFLTFGAIGRIEPRALTSEVSIRFLRPAQGATLFARAELNKAGRSVVGTVSVWTEDPALPCATAQGTYVLPTES